MKFLKNEVSEVVELAEDIPVEGLRGRLMDWTEKFYLAFFIGKALYRNSFLWHPKVIRNRIRYYSCRYQSGTYWLNRREGVHFLSAHSEKVLEVFDQLDLDLGKISVLDLCGGCGNLGLALNRRGLKEYFLNEKSRLVVRWAKKLHRDFGFNLHAEAGDFQKFYSDKKYDVVLALGTENENYSYEEMIRKAAEHQKEQGYLMMTYIDREEYLGGGWEVYYKKWHGYEPSFRDGNYFLSRSQVMQLFEDQGYQIDFIEPVNHQMDNRIYPRYLAVAKRKLKNLSSQDDKPYQHLQGVLWFAINAATQSALSIAV